MSDSYEEFRTLYRAARAEEFSKPADRHAVSVALTASIAAGVQTAATSASAAAVAATGASNAVAGASVAGAKGIIQLLLGGKFVSEIVIGVALGTAVTTTAVVVQRTSERRAAVTDESRATPNTAQPRLKSGQPTNPANYERPQPSQAGVQQLSPAAPKAVETASTRPHVVARDPVTVATATSPPPPIQERLVEETQALAQVQDALSRSDPGLAWSLLQQQEQQFSSGQLGEERAAAKVMTLCTAGRGDLADQARANFLMTYPNSPLTKRVKQGCDH